MIEKVIIISKMIIFVSLNKHFGMHLKGQIEIFLTKFLIKILHQKYFITNKKRLSCINDFYQ